MRMKLMERNVMRLAAVQHLRTAYGIKIKHWNKNKAISCKLTGTQSVKIFGVPLENLPQCTVEHGSVPVFLVNACSGLLQHVDTEGLFRKSGSIVRLKALRTKLDAGEECLSSALPCDVACLVKQFFRELPEPALPAELQEAFLRAQQLGSLADRTAATLLVTCVLPDRTLAVLRYFFCFLHSVSQRSAENKMDGSNLSVILAPNLLHSGDGVEKMNSGTERRLKLQAAVVHCLIEHAQDVGVVPPFLLERLPALTGCEAGGGSPPLEALEEPEHSSGLKRRCRRSLGDMVNGALHKLIANKTPVNTPEKLVFSSSSSATPVIATPSSKRKLPLESGQSYGFSNKKRRSMKKSLGIELLPSALFGGNTTPGSAYSASGVLESSHTAVSPATRSSKQPATSARRKSRRLSNRHPVSRVESGKAGCFSPKVTKKEAVRKSLRLRFSLGKSSREAGTEAIGWRLATQDSISSLRPIPDAGCSPAPLRIQSTTKSSKYISQSEDNLLSPPCALAPHSMSWSGDTPGEGGSFTDTPPLSVALKSSYFSEPAIVQAKAPANASRPIMLCCSSSAESLLEQGDGEPRTRPTLLKIQTAAAASSAEREAGATPCHGATAGQEDRPGMAVNLFLTPPPESLSEVVLGPGLTLPTASAAARTPGVLTPRSCPAREQNVPLGQLEIAPLSPLHINSTLFDGGGFGSPAGGAGEAGDSVEGAGSLDSSDTAGTQAERLSRSSSRLIDALDIQSPARFHLGVCSGGQSTPYRASDLGLGAGPWTPLPGAAPTPGTARPNLGEERGAPAKRGPAGLEKTGAEQQLSPGTLETHRLRVAEHVQRFDRLTLRSPRGTLPRSPLKFQRTPVRQSVRRINSLLGERRAEGRTPAGAAASLQSRPVAKTVSLESGLSAGAQLKPYRGDEPAAPPPAKKPPPVPPKKSSTLLAKEKALGDLTNKQQAEPRDESSGPATKAGEAGAPRPLAVQRVAERDSTRYRGSPRNPLIVGRLLSATKPIDL
ncbi:rho GTPase-activating protein 11A [Aplochiton taeniatus]